MSERDGEDAMGQLGGPKKAAEAAFFASMMI
jgi:hypothetical protein